MKINSTFDNFDNLLWNNATHHRVYRAVLNTKQTTEILQKFLIYIFLKISAQLYHAFEHIIIELFLQKRIIT